MSSAPANLIALTSPPATRTTAAALRDHTNIPHEINNFSLISGTESIHQAFTTSTSPPEQIWAQHYQIQQSSQTEHSLFPHSAWFPQPPYYQLPYPYQWYDPASFQQPTSMVFSPPIVTTVPIPAALPAMPTSQMPVPSQFCRRPSLYLNHKYNYQAFQ